MAKQVIINGETGLVTKNKLNSNFDELYGNGYKRCDRKSVTPGNNTFTLLTAVPNTDYEVTFYYPDGVGMSDITNKTINSFEAVANDFGDVIYNLNEKK